MHPLRAPRTPFASIRSRGRTILLAGWLFLALGTAETAAGQEGAVTGTGFIFYAGDDINPPDLYTVSRYEDGICVLYLPFDEVVVECPIRPVSVSWPTSDPVAGELVRVVVGDIGTDINGIPALVTYEWFRATGSNPLAPGYERTPLIAESEGAYRARQEDIGYFIGVTVRTDEPYEVTRMTERTVRSAAGPPTIAAIDDVVVTIGTPFDPISFTIGDPDTPLGDLNVTVGSDHPTLFPAGSMTVTGSGANRSLQLTPAENESGNATITVSVSDGTTTTDETFLVEVRAGARMVIIVDHAQGTIRSDMPGTFRLSGTVQVLHADGTPLDQNVWTEWTVVPDPPDAAAGWNFWQDDGFYCSTGSIGCTFTATIAGGSPAHSRVRIKAVPLGCEDGLHPCGGLEIAPGYTPWVEIQHAGDGGATAAPTMSPFGYEIAAAVGTPIDAVDFTVWDTDTDVNLLTVTVSSDNPALLPDGSMVLSGTGSSRSLALTPAPGMIGSARITFTVSDGTQQASQTLTVLIYGNPDQPPTASGVMITGIPAIGATLTGAYAYDDADGDPESGTSFAWYRSDDASGGNRSLITGADGSEYIPTPGDLGKFLDFEVTPSNDEGSGTAARSAPLGPVERPESVSVVSIVRHDPVDDMTYEDAVTFRVTFDAPVRNVDPGDFGLTGTSAAEAGITGTSSVDGSAWDVRVSGGPNSIGTLGLVIRGVSGADGSNDIESRAGIRTEVTADVSMSGIQSAGADVGAWFVAPASTFLLGYSWWIVESPAQAATLTVYEGEGFGGPVLGSFDVSIPATSALSLVDFAISPGIPLTAGQVYSVGLRLASSEVRYAGTTGNLPNVGTSAFWGTGESDPAIQVMFDLPGGSIIESSVPDPWEEYTFLRNARPTAGNVAVSGAPEVGAMLTGSYAYSDPESDPESGTTFAWYRADDGVGTNRVPIAGATSSVYVLSPADRGRFVSFEVTPSDAGGSGPAAASDPAGPVELPRTVALTSIVRQDPTDEVTDADEVTFRVSFDATVIHVDASDFLLTGTAAGDGSINGVTDVDGSSFDITVGGVEESEGTLGLSVRGVAGAEGSNDIESVSDLRGPASADPRATGFLDPGEAIGPWFDAPGSTSILRYSMWLRSSEEQSATLRVYEGQGYSGTLIGEFPVLIPAVSGLTKVDFPLPTAVPVSPGRRYSIGLVPHESEYQYVASEEDDARMGISLPWGDTVPSDLAIEIGFDLAAGLLIASSAPDPNEAYTIRQNAQPIAAEDRFTTPEDAALGGNVLFDNGFGADSDPDGDALLVSLGVAPGHGELVLAGDGSFTYTPVANFHGEDVFSYSVSDGRGGVAGASVAITVNPVNDTPGFTKGADQLLLEDAGPRTVPGWATAIVAGPADEATQALSFHLSADNEALFAALPLIDPATGTLTFTPAVDANGVATVTVTLVDDGGTTDGGVDTSGPQAFTITVTPVNDAPGFRKGPDVTIAEDAAPGDVAGWATEITSGPADEAGQALAFSTTVDNGTLFLVPPTVDAAGRLRYTLAPDAHGAASVTVTLADDGGRADGGIDTAPAQVFTFTVTPVNDAPGFTKGPDVVVPEDAGEQAFPGWLSGLSAGAANEAGQAVEVVLSADLPGLFAHGPAVDPATGTLSFTPADDANGVATVEIVVRDDGGTADGGDDTSAAQTFTITVMPVNDAPSFASGGAVTVGEDAGAVRIEGWASPVRTGPADEAAQGGAFTVMPDDPTLFAEAPAIDAETGDLTFTPAAGRSGSTRVVAEFRDFGGRTFGGVDQGEAVAFTITIGPVNDAPVFAPGPDLSVEEDAGAQTVAGWAAPADPGAADEAAQAVTLDLAVDRPELFAAGPSIDPATGTLSFTPAADASGEASVTVTPRDDGGTSNGGFDTGSPATFTIAITPVNDAPWITVPPGQTSTDGSPVVFASVLGTAIGVTDPDAGEAPLELVLDAGSTVELSTTDALEIVAGADGTHTVTARGTLAELNAALEGLVYRPTPGAEGGSRLRITVSDLGATGAGGALTASAEVAITLVRTNRAPVAAPDAAAVFAGESVAIAVLANDGDDDGDPLAVVSATPPTSGTAEVLAGGMIRYTASADFDGTATFDYTVADGRGGQATARVTVGVTGPGTDRDGVAPEVEGAAPGGGDGNGDGTADADQEHVTSLPIATGENRGEYLTLVADEGTRLARVRSLEASPSPDDFPGEATPSVGFLAFEVADLEPAASTVVTILLPRGVAAVDYLKYGPTPDDPAPHWYRFPYDGVTGAVIVPETPEAQGRILLHFTDGLRGDDDLSANGVIVDPGVPVLTTNRAPVATGDVLVVAEDGAGTLRPAANDTDAEGDALSLVTVTSPSHGVVTTTSDGAVTYVPAANYAGPDAFTYRVTDGRSAPVEGTVAITVEPVDDAPVFTVLPEGGVYREGEVATLAWSASDVDSPTLVFAAVELPDGATLDASTGVVTWTVTRYGTASFRVTVSDGTTTVAAAPVRLNVHAVDGFSLKLAGVHQEPGVETPATGAGEVHLVEATDTWVFDVAVEALSGAFRSAWIVAGRVGEPARPVADVTSLAAPSGARGVRIRGEAVIPASAMPVAEVVGKLRVGELALLVATDAYPEGEVRGQLLSPANRAPVAGPIAAPVAVDAGRAGSALEIGVPAADDPDGNPVLYVVQLSGSPAFERVLARKASTRPEAATWRGRELTGVVALLERPVVYARLIVSDGSLWTVSAVAEIAVRGETATATEAGDLPTEFYLAPNYPNPFNPSTTLVFGLPEAARVQIELYDAAGRLVRTLLDEERPAGVYEETVRVDELPTGLYLYRMTAGTRVFTRALHLVK